MIKELIKLANHLDAKGLRKEADYLDSVIRKVAGDTWPTFITQGPIKQSLMIEFQRCCMGLHTAGRKLLDDVQSKKGAGENLIIQYYIKDGEVTTYVQPESNDDLVKAADEIAKSIKSSVLPKLPKTYRGWKLKEGSRDKPESERTKEDYEKAELPVGGQKIILSTATLSDLRK